MKYNDLNNLCKKYRNEIFEKILLTKQGHPGSIFSMIEIAVVLYHGGYVRFDSNKKKFIDKVLVSKGHATSTLYPILKEFGVISKNDWENWGIAKSNLRIFGNISIPGIDITSKLIAKNFIQRPHFSYVRLDRDIQPDLNPSLSEEDFENGFKVFGDISSENTAIISNGKIYHDCHKIYNKIPNTTCINLFRSKPFPKKLIKLLFDIKKIVVVDEQTPGGNLGSCVSENLIYNNIFPKIKIRSLKETYIFDNGGRSYLLNNYGLSEKDIISDIHSLE